MLASKKEMPEPSVSPPLLGGDLSLRMVASDDLSTSENTYYNSDWTVMLSGSHVESKRQNMATSLVPSLEPPAVVLTPEKILSKPNSSIGKQDSFAVFINSLLSCGGRNSHGDSDYPNTVSPLANDNKELTSSSAVANSLASVVRDSTEVNKTLNMAANVELMCEDKETKMPHDDDEGYVGTVVFGKSNVKVITPLHDSFSSNRTDFVKTSTSPSKKTDKSDSSTASTSGSSSGSSCTKERALSNVIKLENGGCIASTIHPTTVASTKSANHSKSGSITAKGSLKSKTNCSGNELHHLCAAANWKALRTCLTAYNRMSKSASSSLQNVSTIQHVLTEPMMTHQVNETHQTPLMLALSLHGHRVPIDVVHLLLHPTPYPFDVSSTKSYPSVASLFVPTSRTGAMLCGGDTAKTITSSSSLSLKNCANAASGTLYPLHMAASKGCSVQVLTTLYEAFPPAIMALDEDGNMPLHVAVHRFSSLNGTDSGNRHNVEGPLYEQNNRNRPRLLANERICYNTCRMLVTAFPEALVHRNNIQGGMTPLLLALYCRSPPNVLELLISAFNSGSNLNTPVDSMDASEDDADETNDNPLFRHTHRNDSNLDVANDAVPELESPLAIPDAGGFYPLHYCHRVLSLPYDEATNRSVLEAIRQMVTLYPSAISARNNLGDTPLYGVMACDHPSSLELLNILLDNYLPTSSKRSMIHCKNNQGLNVLEYGWAVMQLPRIVAAEDQEDEDNRMESVRVAQSSAVSVDDIRGTHAEKWWEKAKVLLKGAYYDDCVVGENTDEEGGKVDDVFFSEVLDKNGNNVFASSKLKKKRWRPLHAIAGTDCPLDMVKFIIQIHPHEVSSTDENMNTPLHIACSRPDIFGAATMRILLDDGNRSYLARARNVDGSTPLHMACLYRAPLEVLSMLVGAYPDAVIERNKEGQTPLFLVVAMARSLEVLRLFLKARPVAVEIRDVHGLSPIALAWHLLLSAKVIDDQHFNLGKMSTRPIASDSITTDIEKDQTFMLKETRRAKSNILSVAYAMASSSLSGDARTWMGRIDFLLRYACYGDLEFPQPSMNNSNAKRQWRAVHASCLGGTCPPAILAFALQILPSEAAVRNEDGNLPIHIASCARPYEPPPYPRQLSVGVGESIDLLLKIHPDGARRLNRSGRLPLHLALENGRTWENGVRSLVDTFPEAVRMRDYYTKMFPFMMASVHYVEKEKAQNEHLMTDEIRESLRLEVDAAIVNTTYLLLRDAPELIQRNANGNAETLFLRRARKELLLQNTELQRQLEAAQDDIQKRMTATELKGVEDTKRKESVRLREEECCARATQLDRSSGQMMLRLLDLETSITQLKATATM